MHLSTMEHRSRGKEPSRSVSIQPSDEKKKNHDMSIIEALDV